ncbi:MAG TPA: hypothetical protein DCK99_14165 [Blastocatellia bacterium]|nr:hypothetical protein [Blastocatellia bacterium]
MRAAWITGADALRARMVNPVQLAAPSPEAEMPPYMESFLAHLRLLIGVPFDYLVADSRLLPDESIRFFYLDRSWCDRLVDGALSVGKIGTREQAHHQAHAPHVQQQLDLTERVVRILQRGLQDFPSAKQTGDQNPQAGQIVTGLLLRSAAVSGWPQRDVRAFSGDVPAGIDPSQVSDALIMPLLRLERLSPSVLVALFQGIPKLVWCEEPHHGVQFAVQENPSGGFIIPVRDASGKAVLPSNSSNNQLPVPLRTGGRRVVAVAQLRKDIIKKDQDLSTQPGMPHLPAQTGAAGYAISVLNPPWRQRFQNAAGTFSGGINITSAVERPELSVAIKSLLT